MKHVVFRTVAYVAWGVMLAFVTLAWLAGAR